MNIIVAKLATDHQTTRRFHGVMAVCDALAREAKIPLQTVVIESVEAGIPPDADLVVLFVGQEVPNSVKGPLRESPSQRLPGWKREA